MKRGAGLLCLLFPLLSACTGVPMGLEPVGGFDLERYLGLWYEIARLDHSFERGLSRVTATYALRKDGGVDVLNRGYNGEKDSWKEARGKAYFVGEPTVGSLKVSFFGPFYGGYNVIRLGEDYAYAVVCGPSRDYLWILSREPRMDQSLLDGLVEFAKGAGFATEELIFVEHGEGG